MTDPLAPLRHLADPSIQLPYEIGFCVDHVCGRIGSVKFAALVLDTGGLAAMLAKTDGGFLMEGHIKAFCRHWGVERGDFIVRGRSAVFEVSSMKEENEMLTPEIDNRGFPSALCKCDVCGRETHERAKHERGRKTLTEGQVLLKLQGKGWTYIKNTLRCPSCEDARKAADKPPVSENAMTEKLKTLKLAMTPTPVQIEPSREQKRQIMALLDSVYDKDRECYSGKESDQSVAEALGAEFKIDWVAQIREEFFGPDGNDSEMVEIVAEIAELQGKVTALQDQIVALQARADAALGRK